MLLAVLKVETKSQFLRFSMGRRKTDADAKGKFFEGFFPKGTTLDGFLFHQIEFILIHNPSGKLILNIPHDSKGEWKQGDTSTTVVSCAAATSSSEDLNWMHHRGVPSPHVCNNLGTI